MPNIKFDGEDMWINPRRARRADITSARERQTSDRIAFTAELENEDEDLRRLARKKISRQTRRLEQIDEYIEELNQRQRR